MASRRTAPPDAPGRALEALTQGLMTRFELSSREAAVLDRYGRACLEQLTAECASLDPSVPPDPTAVPCLLLD